MWVQKRRRCARVSCADAKTAACGVYVNGVGRVWDWLLCGPATLIGARANARQAQAVLPFTYCFQDPRSRTPPLVSGGGEPNIWGHALLAQTPELGLNCHHRCCLLVPGLC